MKNIPLFQVKIFACVCKELPDRTKCCEGRSEMRFDDNEIKCKDGDLDWKTSNVTCPRQWKKLEHFSQNETYKVVGHN